MQDMKGELKKDYGKQKENQTETLEMKSLLSQIKNPGQSLSSRLNQVEDRI
jgi:hypothetical protein